MRRILSVTTAALLAACGGSDDGGGGSPDPGEPNGTFATATPLTPGTPMVVVATITTLNDVDTFSFTVPTGGRSVRFQTFDAGGTQCDPVNGNVDPWVDVYDGGGSFLGGDDDGGLSPWCEDVTLSLPAGTNFVQVGGFAPVPFVYTLKVTIL